MQFLGNILQKNNNNEIFSNILAKQYAGSIGVKTKIMKKGHMTYLSEKINYVNGGKIDDSYAIATQEIPVKNLQKNFYIQN